MQIEFSVIGQPVTQGSKRAMPIYRSGKPVMDNGRPMVRVVNDNPKLVEWRATVAQVARVAYDGDLICGAVSLDLEFVRPRPKSHYGTGRNAERLKHSAAEYPIGKPDTLKLARAVEDALTGVMWRDDSQIVRHTIAKTWGRCFMVHVKIEGL